VVSFVSSLAAHEAFRGGPSTFVTDTQSPRPRGPSYTTPGDAILLSVAGRLAVSGRRVTLHLSSRGRWTHLLLDGITRLRALPAAGAAPG
ncbi:MAG: transposase, partial [Actinomycetota bacterium]|nr:transposase [Actinomycetota bacterium]